MLPRLRREHMKTHTNTSAYKATEQRAAEAAYHHHNMLEWIFCNVPGIYAAQCCRYIVYAYVYRSVFLEVLCVSVCERSAHEQTRFLHRFLVEQ